MMHSPAARDTIRCREPVHLIGFFKVSTAQGKVAVGYMIKVQKFAGFPSLDRNLPFSY